MLTDAELADARATARATMTATLTVHTTDGSAGGWDPSTGPTAPTTTPPLWAGPARIQAVRSTGSGVIDAADQDVAVRAYKVALPHDAPAMPFGARATVTTAPPEDPALTGRVLSVTSSVLGGLAIERVLYCDLDATNQPA
jgi:hypothetical protein